MKVEKLVYSKKLGLDLMVYLSEEDNVIGTNPCALNTRIEVSVVSQELYTTERRFYKNEYWIPNDARKFVATLNKAIRDSENKFSLDAEASKIFELVDIKKENTSSVGDLKINVDVVVDTKKAKEAVNELLESMKFKLSNS